MTESRKIVWNQTARIAIGEAVCVGLMYGIYGLLHKLALPVILGGIVGAVLAIGNFFFMAVIATLAADKAQAQDVEGGQKLMKSSYPDPAFFRSGTAAGSGAGRLRGKRIFRCSGAGAASVVCSSHHYDLGIFWKEGSVIYATGCNRCVYIF